MNCSKNVCIVAGLPIGGADGYAKPSVGGNVLCQRRRTHCLLSSEGGKDRHGRHGSPEFSWNFLTIYPRYNSAYEAAKPYDLFEPVEALYRALAGQETVDKGRHASAKGRYGTHARDNDPFYLHFLNSSRRCS